MIVTGGTGFLGRHLVWRLADAGHDVVFSGRDAGKAREVMSRASQPVAFAALSHGSNNATATLKRAAAGADAIVHCAGLSSPWGRRADFRKANVRSTEEVLATMQTNGVARLVYISTPSLYFQFRDCLAVCEDEPLPPPVNDYAATKGEAERLVRAARVPSVILRPRGIFGAWDETLLPRLLRLLRRDRFPLFNGGDALIDLTHVDNVVDAIELALALPNPIGETFNVSNGQPRRAADLFSELAHTFGQPWRPRHVPLTAGLAFARACEFAGRIARGWEPPITRYSLGTVAFSLTLDLRHARTRLGYVPRVDLDDGIALTAAWMRARSQGWSC
ncbi:NAD(P)-dependent oxidoreductase [Mesorhizobium sp. M0954]|uniref:NAD-dependent epimerase/dehydratase family protein n=1 Tax=Mesorhizobium sp. M0954 TaxID=2957032 RepID=UPI0033367478